MPTSLHEDKNNEVETIIITSPIKLYGMNENIIDDKQLIYAEQEKRDKKQSDNQIKNQTSNERKRYNYILTSEYNHLNKTTQELITKAGFQVRGDADAKDIKNKTLYDKINSILENSISFRIFFIIFSVLLVLMLAYFIINQGG